VRRCPVGEKLLELIVDLRQVFVDGVAHLLLSQQPARIVLLFDNDLVLVCLPLPEQPSLVCRRALELCLVCHDLLAPCDELEDRPHHRETLVLFFDRCFICRKDLVICC